jgi:hypothetical protein
VATQWPKSKASFDNVTALLFGGGASAQVQRLNRIFTFAALITNLREAHRLLVKHSADGGSMAPTIGTT